MLFWQGVVNLVACFPFSSTPISVKSATVPVCYPRWRSRSEFLIFSPRRKVSILHFGSEFLFSFGSEFLFSSLLQNLGTVYSDPKSLVSD